LRLSILKSRARISLKGNDRQRSSSESPDERRALPSGSVP
jgi:hypothetical protein